MISDLKNALPRATVTLLDKAAEDLAVVRKDFYELPKNKRKVQTLLILVQVISALEYAKRMIEMIVLFSKILLIDIEKIIINSPG